MSEINKATEEILFAAASLLAEIDHWYRQAKEEDAWLGIGRQEDLPNTAEYQEGPGQKRMREKRRALQSAFDKLDGKAKQLIVSHLLKQRQIIESQCPQ